jgi:RNA polymerase sigma factor (sigma-70 family)
MDRQPENGQEDLDGPDAGPIADEEIANQVRKSHDIGDLSSISALSSFVRQMARYPLLSPEAQTELARDCQKAQRSRAALAAGKLTKAQERQAQADVKRGEYAMTHLLGSTIRLVIVIVRENAERRFGQQKALAMSPDLVSECMVSLTKAVYDFDPARIPSFSTYAGRIVRDTVRMSLGNDSMVKVPASWARIRRIAAVRIPKLAIDLGRPPTQEESRAEIYKHCLVWAEEHLTPEQAAQPKSRRHELMVAKLRKQGMLGALDKLGEVLNTARPMGSLDRVLGDDGGSTVGDLVPAPTDDATFDSSEHDELRSSIHHALDQLPERERGIVILRFDLNETGEVWTYKRIAAQYGITAERIRQIERNALAKMRNPHGPGEGLSGFLPSEPDSD